MKIIFFITLVLLMNFDSLAQKNNLGIELLKVESKKKIFLKENTKIKIWVYETEEIKTFSGKLKIVDNETIQLKGVNFKLSEIKIIAHNKLRSKIGGGILIGGGTSLITAGVFIFNDAISSNNIISFLVGIIASGITITVGSLANIVGITMFAYKAKYDISNGKWTVKIKSIDNTNL